MHEEDHSVPYWAKLLLAWEQMGGAGLTLPFLTGAQTVKTITVYPSIKDAEYLLEEIFTRGIAGRTICINWCGIAKAYGICMVTGEPQDGIYLSTPASIFIVDLACQEFGSLPEDIISGLAALYSGEISARTYSITSGKWQPYDDADKKFIKHALAL